MKSKKIFPVLISLLLIALIVTVLVGNKKEIDRKAQLSLQTNAVVPVNVTQPRWTEMNPSISVTGRIVSANNVILVSKAQGTVLAKYKKTGDRVTKGTPIAKLEDHLVRENLRVAESGLAKAQKDAERYETLQKAGAVTKTETEAVLLALKNAEQQVFDLKDHLQNTLITATAPGILENVDIEEGSLVTAGMTVAEIIDPDRLKMEISVTEQEVVRLKTGQAASIESDVFAGKVFDGVVAVVGTKGNDALSYKVEIALRATDELKPGMFAVAHIESGSGGGKRKCLTIDRRCLTGGLKKPEVYVVSGEIVRKRSIITGETCDNQVEILQGLTENETVVLDGQINLTEGTTVEIKN